MTGVFYCSSDELGIILPNEILGLFPNAHAYCAQIPDEAGLLCLGVYTDITRFSDEERRNADKVHVICGRLQVPLQFREKLNDCVVIVSFENRLEIWPQDDWMAASERLDDIDLEGLLKELGL